MAANPPIPFPTQTARFKLLVARCGQPDTHLTLVAPEKDPELQRLARQSRVLTVHQAIRGAGADYGLVGLFKERGNQLLVFPKSLRRFAGKRIVGIDYSLLTGATNLTAGRTGLPARRETKKEAAKTRKAFAGMEPAVRKPKPLPKVIPIEIEPPTMPQVLQKLQAIGRMLSAREYTLARTELGTLSRKVRAGLALDQNKPGPDHA